MLYICIYILVVSAGGGYVFIYICVYIHIYLFACTCICIFICMYIDMYTHIYLNHRQIMGVIPSSRFSKCDRGMYTYTHVCVYIYVYMYIHIHVCVCVCVYLYIYVYSDIYSYVSRPPTDRSYPPVGCLNGREVCMYCIYTHTHTQTYRGIGVAAVRTSH